MNALRWMVVGAVLGLSASMSVSCGTPVKKCTPSSCAAGCCDSTGNCQLSGSASQCGGLGGACIACSAGQSCQFGVCTATGTGGASGGGSGGGSTGGGTGGALGGGAGGAFGGGTGGSFGGGTGGSFGGGTGGGSLCGPPNCAGCCGLSGCVNSPNNANNTTCGSSGNACQDCAAFSSICNPSTHTCGAVGGGGGTGGGGGFCDGCLLPSGTCVPLNRTSVINCGQGGVACSSCASGELCLNGTCTLPVTTKRVGDPCVNDAACQVDLGSLAICKQTTTSGNGFYSGGYCTLPCGTATNQCPSGAVCVGLLPAYGEADTICWDECSATDRCRTPGYGCYTLTTGNACWISPIPVVDAGRPADKVGNACASTANCINPPDTDGICLTSEFSLTWPGGYCSKSNCLTNPECSADGGALCIGLDSSGSATCVRRCLDSRDAGQSNCRAGYKCNQYFTALGDGGQQASTDGFCSP